MSLLGRGATGRVYRAEDTVLHRYVALKLFHPGDSPIERRRTEQFIREARSAARLEHPNIVRVHEINHVGGWYYIAMELVEGGTLLQMARTLARDPARACQLLADAAEGLAAAHAAGIVHRDVKPANLFVSRDGRCKVGDFGMASLRDPGDGLPLANEAAGTPMYAPPEVLTGAAATPASDIYSFACTAFHLLAGRPPFQSAHRKELLWMHVRARPESLGALRPDVPSAV
ncbi:MAG: serine/threonine-protein kinase, partial [Tepidisphaeraceae bacterium]